eukprot:gnl/Dysnectes_brevis/7059_a11492_326.p1 GENE.gnl/Dysnectes_brevis/7059_a11492_326~~gnl/Dysnectes_brevis/7059_a11492_326.p1  ORF type:complete len:418 (+),score=71.79 gnl/Dysnectes_brevis/7059_a11492_326:29-1282(+)
MSHIHLKHVQFDQGVVNSSVEHDLNLAVSLINSSLPRITSEHIKKYLFEPRNRNFLLFSDSTLIGACCCRYHFQILEISFLAIHTSYRREGYGATIVKAVLASAEEARLPHVLLYGSTEALPFFHKLGFTTDIKVAKSMYKQKVDIYDHSTLLYRSVPLPGLELTLKKMIDSVTPKDSRKTFKQWSTFIYKVLKQVTPEMGISMSAMALFNRLIVLVVWNYLLALEDLREGGMQPQQALPAITGVLVGEGTSLAKAIRKDSQEAIDKYFKGSSGQSVSARAGLLLPIGLVMHNGRLLETSLGMSKPRPWMLGLLAAVEGLLVEIITVSSAVATEQKKLRLTSLVVFQGIQGDTELAEALDRCLVNLGFLPNSPLPRRPGASPDAPRLLSVAWEDVESYLLLWDDYLKDYLKRIKKRK